MSSRRPGRGAASATVAATLLAGAWLWPPLAVPVIWPLLFVVPGWLAISWLAPRLSLPGRLGLAIVISVAASTHLTYWIGVALGPFTGGHGYGRPAVFVAAAILASSVPLAAWAGTRLDLRAARRAIRQHAGPLALAGAMATFVGVVLGFGLWRLTPAGVSAGGSNWSDLPVHLSIAESLNAGNFPPQVPYFAGEPLVYHWFADFHAAIAAQAAGLFSVPAFVAGSAVGAFGLALCVHGLATRLFRGQGVGRAALIGMTLAVAAGGLGWTRLVSDLVGGGDLAQLVTNNSYDNFWYDSAGAVSWPYFRIPSVMG
ncbi:MAG: hypothetical protein ABI622_09385, partial [Chloroflexota bacterium]